MNELMLQHSFGFPVRGCPFNRLNHRERSAAKPQPNGVRPSSGAETSDGDKCESNPESRSSLKLLRPGTAALRKFVAPCEQFRPLQCSAAKPQPNGVRPSSGAETSDGDKCESNPEPRSSPKLLRPGTAAPRKFVAPCEQFRPLQCSAAEPQPNGVRPSSGAETSDGDKCESNPEPRSSLKLLRPATAALRKFVAPCEQFRPLQCSAAKPQPMKDLQSLCTEVRQTAYDIHLYHAHGHLEKVYDNAPAHRLRKAGLDV